MEIGEEDFSELVRLVVRLAIQVTKAEALEGPRAAARMQELLEPLAQRFPPVRGAIREALEG